MNQTQTFQILIIKALAIIGFVITVGILVLLVAEGFQRAPIAFSSLASIAESIQKYRIQTPAELAITTDQSAVNSGEPFQISWNSMNQPGVYTLSYTCTPGITLTVTAEDAEEAVFECTEILSFTERTNTISVTAHSKESRIADVPLTLVFTDAAGSSYTSGTKLTVANATIPIVEVPEKEETPIVVNTPPEKPEVPTQPKPQAPIVTTVYPQSNPNGFIDLSVTTRGSGILKNEKFVFTPKYDSDEKNAIRFDVKNIGTKTSGEWTFTTVLPDGSTYESPTQEPLKPLEYVVFTLGFNLNTNKKLVEIVHTVSTKDDTVSKNNTTTWYVAVAD